ncbi:Flp pilus assembly protein CpaB [Aquibaculum sediminis]|uniref:Flp pilus assembly protein CpaB n=1 Tax=Aquibaculum sediminis TaxID=3231907 RepID=UPI0034536BCE
MRASTLLLVTVALLAAGGTAYVGQQWLASQQAQSVADATQPQVEATRYVQIMAAAEDLPTGTVLRESHILWQDWPEDAPALNYYRQDEVELEELLGAVLRSPVSAGEPVSRTRLVQQGERGFLAAILTPGMRAVSVPVNATTGIAGLVMPGDRVDLMLSHAYDPMAGDSRGAGRAATTVLGDLRVLAIDQRVDHQAGEPFVAKNVTLEVTAKQAEALAVANDLGVLTLALRAIGEESDPLPMPTNGSPGLLQAAALNGSIASDAVAAEEPAPRGYRPTLDSEVVPLLAPPPEEIRAAKPRVTVVRGGEVSVVGGEEES